MTDEQNKPAEQDETQLADLDVEETSHDVRGGMTKQEIVAPLGSKADLSKLDLPK